MELTILLSQAFGIYFLIVGVIMLVRYKYIKGLLSSFVENPMLRFLIGAFILLGGIFIVLAHNDWETVPAIFISLIGWLTLVKGILYMSLSNGLVQKWVHIMYGKWGYGWWGSLLAIALGLYLTNFGFAWY
jgi:hypothetical protein